MNEYLPPLIKEKNREQNKFAQAKDESYRELLKNEKSTLEMWTQLFSGGFRVKELQESFDFVHRIRKYIRHKTAMEFFCGHGLIGQILVRQHLLKEVYQVDSLWSKWRKIIYSLYNNQNVYPIVDQITLDMPLEKNVGLVYSMHGCGNLTDITIDYAIKHHLDVIVCPCCYQKAQAPHQMFGEHRIDQWRVAKLLFNNYEVHVKHLPQAITPMNRVIIANLHQ